MNAQPSFALFGRDLFGEVISPPSKGLLADRFEWPPFSVLNARDGEWQERKRCWIALGLQGEIGRAAAGSNAWGDLSENPRSAESTKKIAAVGDQATVFDPVLCELSYRWFCPSGGLILDPFAGGSTRGIVAGLLGYRYHGIDLRAEQVSANEAQRATIAPDASIEWATGDSARLAPDAPLADLVFSCPPYGDLERYSDDPADLSTMAYEEFIASYRTIVAASVARLRADRFACFVVGDFRDKRTGHYRGFVADTITAFRDAGAALYNDAVLVTAVGSLSLRAAIPFATTRKLGKTHQNVLVFVKGDARKAAAACSGEPDAA